MVDISPLSQAAAFYNESLNEVGTARGGGRSIFSQSDEPKKAVGPETLDAFTTASMKYNVPADVLLALAEKDSGFDTYTRSRGPGPKTRGIINIDDDQMTRDGINPYVPAEAIESTARKFRGLLDQGMTLEQAIAAHAAGPKGTAEPSAVDYAKDVMARAPRLADEYYPAPAQPAPAPVEAAAAPVAEPTMADNANDVATLFAKGVSGAIQHTNELTHMIPGVGTAIDAIDRAVGGKTLAERGKEIDEKLDKSLTPAMTEARKKQWLDDNFKFGDAWGDWRSYVGGIVESIPETALTSIPVMRLTKGIYAARLAAGAGSKAAAAAAAKAATISGAASEGLLGGAASKQSVEEKISKLPIETLRQSDAFQTLVASGMSEEKARESLAKDQGAWAFVLGTVATGMFSGLGDRVLAKTFLGHMGEDGARGLLTRVGKAAAGEGVFEEAPQSAGQQFAENVAVKTANPQQSLMEGVPNQAAGGAVMGAAMGMGMGVAFEGTGGSQPQQPPAAAKERREPTFEGSVETAPEGVAPIVEPQTRDGVPPTATTEAARDLAAGAPGRQTVAEVQAAGAQVASAPGQGGAQPATAPGQAAAPAPEGPLSRVLNTGAPQAATLASIVGKRATLTDEMGSATGSVITQDADGILFKADDGLEMLISNDLVTSGKVVLTPEGKAGPAPQPLEVAPAPVSPAVAPEAAPAPVASEAAQPVAPSAQPVVNVAPPAQSAPEAAQPPASATPVASEEPSLAAQAVAAEPPPVALKPTYEDMTEAELRDRLKYLAQQGRANGWSKKLTEEKKKVEAAIDALKARPFAPATGVSEAAPEQVDVPPVPVEQPVVAKEPPPPAPLEDNEPRKAPTPTDEKTLNWLLNNVWGSRLAAQASIDNRGLSDAYEVKDNGKGRFTIAPKAEAPAPIAPNQPEIPDSSAAPVIPQPEGFATPANAETPENIQRFEDYYTDDSRDIRGNINRFRYREEYEAQLPKAKAAVERTKRRIAKTEELGYDPQVNDRRLGTADIALTGLRQTLQQHETQVAIIEGMIAKSLPKNQPAAPVASNETPASDTQAPLPVTGEAQAETAALSTEAVEPPDSKAKKPKRDAARRDTKKAKAKNVPAKAPANSGEAKVGEAAAATETAAAVAQPATTPEMAKPARGRKIDPAKQEAIAQQEKVVEEKRKNLDTAVAEKNKLLFSGRKPSRGVKANADAAVKNAKKELTNANKELRRIKGVKPKIVKGKPQSLVFYLRGLGGVRDEGGDLKSAGFTRFPGLITKSGWSMDEAREKAAEAGYLGDDIDAAMSETTVNDLIEAIDAHPRYSVHDRDAVFEGESKAAERETREKYDAALKEVNDILNAAETDYLDSVASVAAGIMLDTGMDAADALELAVKRRLSEDYEELSASQAQYGFDALERVDWTDAELLERLNEFPEGYEGSDQEAVGPAPSIQPEGASGYEPRGDAQGEARASSRDNQNNQNAPEGSGAPQEPAYEVGADNKPQAVIPGAEKAKPKTLAEMKASAPLKGTAPQQAAGGMFDEANTAPQLFDQPSPDTAQANIPMKGARGKALDAGIKREVEKQRRADNAAHKERSAQTAKDRAQAKALFAEYAEKIIEANQGKYPKGELRQTLKSMAFFEPAKFINLVEKFKAENEGGPDSALYSMGEQEPVAVLTGKELMDFNGGADMPTLRKAATAWYDNNLRDTTAKMADGTEVKFGSKGSGKTTSGGKGDVLLRSVPAIRQIVEKGRVVLREPGNKDHIEERMVIAAPVMFDGQIVHLAVSVHKQADGNWHYDFTRDTSEGAGAPVPSRGNDARASLGSLDADASDVNIAVWPSLDNKMSKETLRETLVNGPEGAAVAAMIDSGKVVLHDTADTTPGYSTNLGLVQGVVTPDGRIHVVAKNVSPQTALAVILHEAFHAGAKALVGTPSWNALMRRVRAAADSGNPDSWGAKAKARAERALLKPGQTAKDIDPALLAEEIAAYAIENRERAPVGIREAIDNFLGKLKSWALQRFGKQFGAVTPGQLRALAVSALRSSALPANTGRQVYSKGPMKGIIAYHGSPHSFDRFDLSKIGTGEGAQAYGHGLYFAESEGVARSYRNGLSGPGVKNASGEVLALSTPEERTAAKLLHEHNGDFASAWLDAGKIVEGRKKFGLPDVDHAQSVLDLLDKWELDGIQHYPGSMYQVRINADPELFLDWDKPLSEQPKIVQEALAKKDPDMWSPDGNDYDASELGQAIYQRLGQQASATEVLREAGIPGIKYLDQGSRGAGEGSYNYVVFEDSLIEIENKYSIADTEDAATPAQPKGPVFQKFKNALSDIMTQAMVGGGSKEGQISTLAAVPVRALFTELSEGMPAARNYIDFKQQMDQFRNEMNTADDKLVKKWNKLARKNKAENESLMRLMHGSTLAEYDPSLTSQERRAKGMAAANADLDKAWSALPDEAKQLYAEVRDAYSSRADAVEKQVVENVQKAIEVSIEKAKRRHKERLEQIRDEGLTGKDEADAIKAADDELKMAETRGRRNKAARLKRMRSFFESNRMKGPYFPLARFGNYFVTLRNKDGKVLSFEKFESRMAQRRRADELRAQHGNGAVFENTAERQASDRAGMDAGYATQIDAILDEAGVDLAVRDAIYQAYLETMPDLSMRKARIHRKGTAGFDEDAIRAYASNMFHSAHQLSRLRFNMDMQNSLEKAREQIRALNGEDAIRAQAVWNEMRMAHEFSMNPEGSSLSNYANSAVFLWTMAGNLSTAMVNVLQTVNVGIPVLAYDKDTKQVGVPAATKALWRAAKAFAKGRGSVLNAVATSPTDKIGLSPIEQQAVQEAYDLGIIDSTQAHDIAGVADKGVNYRPWLKNIMDLASAPMHHAERMNREVTFLGAYRIAKEAGLSHEASIKKAADQTWMAHFDNQSSSKPRFARGDVGKVIFALKSYQANFVYRIFRDLHQMNVGKTAEEQQIAKKRFLAMLGLTAAVSGVPGTFFMGTLMAIGKAFLGLTDKDDDDPEEMLRKLVAETAGDSAVGRAVAGMVLDGVPGYVTGTAISNRTSMADMWFRSRDREGATWGDWVVDQVVPIGILNQIGQGKKEIEEGRIERGLEKMAPAALRNIMKAGRYASEGVLDKYGNPIVEKRAVTENPWAVTVDFIKQATGFTPAEIADRYGRNEYQNNRQRRIMDKATKARTGVARAMMAGDAAAEAEGYKAVDAFNSRYPEMPILPKSIMQSMRNMERRRDRMEEGVDLNPRLADRIKEGTAPSLYRR